MPRLYTRSLRVADRFSRSVPRQDGLVLSEPQMATAVRRCRNDPLGWPRAGTDHTAHAHKPTRRGLRTMILRTRPELTDQLIEFYCDWRMRCEDVRATYEHFTTAPAAKRAIAFAANEAALDREESAADAYAQQIRRVALAA
jgi:hypothetical protein